MVQASSIRLHEIYCLPLRIFNIFDISLRNLATSKPHLFFMLLNLVTSYNYTLSVKSFRVSICLKSLDIWFFIYCDTLYPHRLSRCLEQFLNKYTILFVLASPESQFFVRYCLSWRAIIFPITKDYRLLDGRM